MSNARPMRRDCEEGLDDAGGASRARLLEALDAIARLPLDVDGPLALKRLRAAVDLAHNVLEENSQGADSLYGK